MNEEILIVNEKNLIGKQKAENEPYEYVKYEIIPRNEFNQCYLAIYEIPPLKTNYPYHYHIANTEAFFIISGQGILKTSKRYRKMKIRHTITMVNKYYYFYNLFMKISFASIT